MKEESLIAEMAHGGKKIPECVPNGTFGLVGQVGEITDDLKKYLEDEFALTKGTENE